MPEQNPLPEDMKVEEYLKYRGKLKGLSSSECKSRVSKVMEMCELDRGKTPRSHIHTLSKGFRQRVGVADAVLANPELVILDEPTIGLDPHQVINFRNLIASLRGEMSVIVSSHILEEVERCCDRVLIWESRTMSCDMILQKLVILVSCCPLLALNIVRFT